MKLGIGALPLKGMDDKAPGTSSLPNCDQTYMSNTHHGVNNIENIGHKSIKWTYLWYSKLLSILTKYAHYSFYNACNSPKYQCFLIRRCFAHGSIYFWSAWLDCHSSWLTNVVFTCFTTDHNRTQSITGHVVLKHTLIDDYYIDIDDRWCGNWRKKAIVGSADHACFI